MTGVLEKLTLLDPTEELTRTAVPSAAQPRIWRWICAFAPTSTPWVGSSTSSTRGDSRSHFPNRIFC